MTDKVLFLCGESGEVVVSLLELLRKGVNAVHSTWEFTRSQSLKEPYSTITPILYDCYAADVFAEEGMLVFDFAHFKIS